MAKPDYPLTKDQRKSLQLVDILLEEVVKNLDLSLAGKAADSPQRVIMDAASQLKRAHKACHELVGQVYLGG